MSEVWDPRKNQEGVGPPFYPEDKYTCPLTGFTIQKDVLKNLEQRQKVWARCDEDPEYRIEFIKRCAASPLLAINLLFWTELVIDVHDTGSQFEVQGEKARPFVTWPAQDREIYRIMRCRERGLSMRGVKTREVGWSWIFCAYATWALLFQKSAHMMFISRKEDEVDAIGKPDSLFAKVRYNLSPDRMPMWLHPTLGKIRTSSKHLLIRNPETDSNIQGEATVEGAGRSGRKSFVVIDEAAEIRRLSAMLQSLSGTTTSRFVISTGKPGSDFNKLFDEKGWEDARLFWFEDRRKAKGLKECPQDGEHPHGMTSPWYEHKLATSTPQQMAQEVNASLLGAGERVFDQVMLERHLSEFKQEPSHVGEIHWMDSMRPNHLSGGDAVLQTHSVMTPYGDIAWDEGGGREEWKLFCDLEPCHKTGMMRPPQTRLYVIGADVGGGQERSNSSIVVLDASDERARLAAYWASSRWEPHDLARIMVGAAFWFGGYSLPLLGWETNGPGGALKRYLVDTFRYPKLYKKRTYGKAREKRTDIVGWNTTSQLKQAMLQHLADSLASRSLEIPSEYVVSELQDFIYKDGGDIVQGKRSDLQTKARENHADTGMALAGAYMMLQELPRFSTHRAEMAKASRDPSTYYGVKTRRKLQAKNERKGRRSAWRR